MNVTFDTNVLISATLWSGSVSQKLLFLCLRKEIRIFTTAEILDEYGNVLKRDFNYSAEELAGMLKLIDSATKTVKPSMNICAVEPDPADNKIIECALESKSECLITYDGHLLRLGKCRGIKIITPEDAIREIE
jgi:uncharacterized protein